MRITDILRNKKYRLVFITVYSVIIVAIYLIQISPTIRSFFISDRKYPIKELILDKENLILKYKIDSLLQVIESQQSIAVDTVRLDNKSEISFELDKLNQRIEELALDVEKNSESYIALRQSLNPINPDEVLTIVRMMDEVKSLKEVQNNFEKRVEENMKSIGQNVIYRSESSDKTANIILLVLVPIIINFLYTVWKDYKKDKPETT